MIKVIQKELYWQLEWDSEDDNYVIRCLTCNKIFNIFEYCTGQTGISYKHTVTSMPPEMVKRRNFLNQLSNL